MFNIYVENTTKIKIQRFKFFPGNLFNLNFYFFS